MGIWKSIKGFFKKDTIVSVPDPIPVTVVEYSKNLTQIPDVSSPIIETKNPTRVYTHVTKHRTKEESSEIQERSAMSNINPSIMLPPITTNKIDIVKNNKYRKLSARRKKMRDLALQRPNGTEVA